jgi:hypothetical protein
MPKLPQNSNFVIKNFPSGGFYWNNNFKILPSCIQTELKFIHYMQAGTFSDYEIYTILLKKWPSLNFFKWRKIRLLVNVEPDFV